MKRENRDNKLNVRCTNSVKSELIKLAEIHKCSMADVIEALIHAKFGELPVS